MYMNTGRQFDVGSVFESSWSDSVVSQSSSLMFLQDNVSLHVMSPTAGSDDWCVVYPLLFEPDVGMINVTGISEPDMYCMSVISCR